MNKRQDNRVKTRLMGCCCDNASRRKRSSMQYKYSNHKLVREKYIEDFLLKFNRVS